MADYVVAEINRLTDESKKSWRMITRLKQGKALEKLRAPRLDSRDD